MTRRGMMLIEAMVAGAIAGTLLMLCLQLVSASVAQRRAAEQRQCAILELGNLMERVAARPWNELTATLLERERLSASANRQLPGAELKIAVSASADQPNAKRITASLRWQDRTGQLVMPVMLTTWKYRIVTNTSP